MIIFDTETTGLPAAGGLENQPHIIEFAAIKLDQETLEEKGRLEFLCKPPIQLSPKITEITGIKNEDLVGCQPFKAHYKELIKFFWGEWEMVAHNVAFDCKMLSFELRRMAKEYKFPWPTKHTCTVNETYSMNNRRLKLEQLHQELFDESFAGAHRAMVDVEALTRCYIELKKRGICN